MLIYTHIGNQSINVHTSYCGTSDAERCGV